MPSFNFHWTAILVNLILNTNCCLSNLCPETPCYCINETADCSYRNLQSLTGLKNHLPVHIKVLDLSGNTFKNITKNFFQPIASLKLEKLNLNNNRLQCVPDFQFPSIKVLDLSRNNLTYKTIKEVLDSLRGSPIQDLDVSDVKDGIGRLSNVTFESLENCPLESLHLRHWNLVNIPDGTFSNLGKLETLDLSNNKIMGMTMRGLHNLKNLNLTLNELSAVPRMCDVNNKSFVPYLENLQLAINHISDSLQFKREGHCLTSLVHLNLSFNAISILKSKAFSTLTNLSTLRLDYMLTYDLLIEKNAFMSKSLTELGVGSNKRVTKEMLQYKDIFKNSNNIKILDMSYFDFSTFSDEDFCIMLSWLHNLENIRLRYCLFNSVPFISHLYKLKSLNLNGNYIRHVHKDSFRNNSKLNTIILRKNQLTSIHEDSFTEAIWNNPDLRIDVSFNPFACDCDLEWFITWARTNKRKIINYAGSQCDSPKEWKGNPIEENVQKLERTCHDLNRIVVTAITIGSFVFIFLFIFVLVRKLRWDILYHLHNCTSRRHGYQILSDNSEKEYDAFVAYNTHDRKWIMSELVESLEKKEGYKLCLHERNFLPIGSHVDNIFENIEASRNLILVLSNNFMEDQWCQFETIIANHKLADGNKDNIFLILLDGIDSNKNFTIALKTLLKEVQNVEWTTNANGRKLFWKRLKSFMDKHR